MLNVSEELKNILRNDRFPLTDTITPKDLEVIFDGMDPIYADQIVDDTFELTESIISDDDIRFGTCRASQIKFKLANVSDELKGREFTINQLIGDSDVIPLGKFKVNSAKLQDDLIFKDVIAYDKLADLDVNVADWYNGLFPEGDETYTLAQFRANLLDYLGIEYENQTLPNDDMTVTKTIEPTQISGRTVLEATVELNGAFGHINRQGKFVRIVLPKLIDSTPEEITKDIYMTVKFEEYEVKPVDKLQVRSEEDDIGAIYGEGINTYVIQGNFLLYGKTAEELQTIAENVSANIFGRAYRPYTAESIGLPYLEVGDTVELTTEDTVVSYILQRTLTGIQALKDEFEAPGSEEREENFGANNEIIQLQGKFAKIKKDVDGIVQTVGDIEQGVYTEIEQLADQLVLKVDKDGNVGLFKLSSEEDGTQVLIKADNISLEGLTTINNNFKVLEDGTIEAVDGSFEGHVEATTGSIAGFDFTDDPIAGGLYYSDNGKFFRISPLSSFSGDGEGGSNPNYATIDLGTVDADGKINTNIHLRNDGYARFGLVREGGYSVRLNDYLRYQATNGEIGTDTIFYSQNFQIGTDGKVRIESPDVTKPIKSIDVIKNTEGSIISLMLTYSNNAYVNVAVEYNENGDITKIGDTIINY